MTFVAFSVGGKQNKIKKRTKKKKNPEKQKNLGNNPNGSLNKVG